MLRLFRVYILYIKIFNILIKFHDVYNDWTLQMEHKTLTQSITLVQYVTMKQMS